MSNRSYSVKRRYVETYRGFDIVKETTATFFFSGISRRYYNDLVERTDVRYRICKEGDNKKPSQFVVFSESETVKEAKEQIDKIVNHEKGYIFVTEEEYKKNVRDKNKKNDYAFSYADICKLIKQHREGDEKQKFFVLERLESCNFHGIYSLVANEEYEEAEETAAEEMKMYKDINVTITTKRSMFKMTPKITEAIKEAVEQAIKKHFNGDVDDVLVTESTNC